MERINFIHLNRSLRLPHLFCLIKLVVLWAIKNHVWSELSQWVHLKEWNRRAAITTAHWRSLLHGVPVCIGCIGVIPLGVDQFDPTLVKSADSIFVVRHLLGFLQIDLCFESIHLHVDISDGMLVACHLQLSIFGILRCIKSGVETFLQRGMVLSPHVMQDLWSWGYVCVWCDTCGWTWRLRGGPHHFRGLGGGHRHSVRIDAWFSHSSKGCCCH